MPPSITQQAMRAASKAVAAALGDEFSRQGLHLYRRPADVFHCLHFQPSQWGTSDRGRFTINLVVTAPFLYEPWVGTLPWLDPGFPKNPATAAFPIQRRIGHVMPANTDHWWVVGRSTDLVATAGEAMLAVTQYGLPFLAEWPNTRAILDRVRSGTATGLTHEGALILRAMAAAYLGDRDDAQQAISAALATADSQIRRDQLSALAKSLSLSANAKHG